MGRGPEVVEVHGQVCLVIAFFLIAYALSWFGMLGNRLWPSSAWPLPINPLGPLVAAPLTLWLLRGRGAVRDWASRMLRFRAPARIYMTAFLVPLAIIVVSAGLALATGATATRPAPAAVLELLLVAPILVLMGPLPEEPGFRGLGQFELQAVVSPFTAAILIGVGVLIWHAPLFALGNLPPPVAIAIVAVSVVYAWLYIASGSIWPLVLLHWTQNVFGGELVGASFEPAGNVRWLWFLASAYVIWAAWLLMKFGPSLGRAGPRRG